MKETIKSQMMTSARKWGEVKSRVHIKAYFIRSNGEYQEKDTHIWCPVEWLDEVLDVYWADDEAEVKVIIEDEVFYWKHPTLTAPITIEEIEETERIDAERFTRDMKLVGNFYEVGASDSV